LRILQQSVNVSKTNFVSPTNFVGYRKVTDSIESDVCNTINTGKNVEKFINKI